MSERARWNELGRWPGAAHVEACHDGLCGSMLGVGTVPQTIMATIFIRSLILKPRL